MKIFEDAYRKPPLLRLDVLEGNGEMYEEQIDVSQSPSLVLDSGHSQSVLSAVVVVPQLRGDEDLLTLYDAFFYGTLNTFTRFFLVLVVIGAVEASVAGFNSLQRSVGVRLIIPPVQLTL